MMRTIMLAALALGATAPADAARVFHLTYTTSVDATSGPAVSVDALVTTDDGAFFGDGYLVTGISGTRGGQAISFNDNLDEIYYPANAAGDYLDSFGLTFFSGGTLYQLYKDGAGDFAYHEFDGATGRLVFPAALSLSPAAAVPEPASWAFMLAGLGLAGGAMRRRSTPALA